MGDKRRCNSQLYAMLTKGPQRIGINHLIFDSKFSEQEGKSVMGVFFPVTEK